MADEQIRRLERAAAQGDQVAATHLAHARRRLTAPKTVKPTSLNLWVMSEMFKGADAIANRFPATSRPHLVRLVRAGLVEVKANTLQLTAPGRAALGR